MTPGDNAVVIVISHLLFDDACSQHCCCCCCHQGELLHGGRLATLQWLLILECIGRMLCVLYGLYMTALAWRATILKNPETYLDYQVTSFLYGDSAGRKLDANCVKQKWEGTGHPDSSFWQFMTADAPFSQFSPKLIHPHLPSFHYSHCARLHGHVSNS